MLQKFQILYKYVHSRVSLNDTLFLQSDTLTNI